MVKRFVLIFFILMVGLFFLFTGVFGENGFLENRNLQREILNMEKELLILDSQIESLSQRSDTLSSEDGLRESALKLGYNVIGDEVYIFNSSSLQKTHSVDQSRSNDVKDYKPLSKEILLILAFGTSLVITLLLSLAFTAKKEVEGDKDDSKQIQSGNNSDYLFFN